MVERLFAMGGSWLTPEELEEPKGRAKGRRAMGSGVDWTPVFVRAAGLRLRVGRTARDARCC